MPELSFNKVDAGQIVGGLPGNDIHAVTIIKNGKESPTRCEGRGRQLTESPPLSRSAFITERGSGWVTNMKFLLLLSVYAASALPITQDVPAQLTLLIEAVSKVKL